MKPFIKMLSVVMETRAALNGTAMPIPSQRVGTGPGCAFRRRGRADRHVHVTARVSRRVYAVPWLPARRIYFFLTVTP